MAQQIQDEGFHEIQLNGKQLVFLFMAATVVSVVIFLCGVLVGRGVRSQIGGAADNASANSVAETTPTQPATPAAAPAAGSDPTTAAPPPASDELSYFNRLEKQSAPAEQLKPAPERPATAAAPAPRPSAKEKEPRAAVPAAPPPAASSSSEPSGQGFAVQIAALNVRSEADAIAKRLSSKGYAAYVLTPASGTPSVFRVRVGKFPTRREAETVAARLEKEEQFKPWVTR
ncbi:MAG: rare lipoprotein [Acidobacteria bacterium]|nr:rare lipoprotein [Acidobacteriota bacterium]